MNQRSSLFLWIFGTLMLILLGMLYWSSTLLEADMKVMLSEIRALRRDSEGLKLELQRSRQTAFSGNSEKEKNASSRPNISEKYPNLLENDPFYEKTLPELLGPAFQPKGTRREGIQGKPENLHPFNGFHDVASMWSMCTVSVSQLQFGKYETLAPNMAIKLEARPIPGQPSAQEYWIHLREGVYWQPLDPKNFPEGFELSPHFLKKHPVTAADFKFYFDAIMNMNLSEAKAVSLRNYFGDIEEIRVIDDLTFVVRWKTQMTKEGEKEIPKVKYTALSLTGSLQPLPCFVYQYFSDGKKIIEDDDAPNSYRVNSIWAQNFSQHWAKNVIVSCGPWLFEEMTDEGIRFRRNPDYYQFYEVLVEALHYSFKESAEAIWQDFKVGKSDLCTLAPSQLAELDVFLESSIYQTQTQHQKAVEQLEYLDLVFFYIGWNEATPFFHEKKERLAMTLAIDRNRIIEQNLNDMGMIITGPFYRYSAAYDASIKPWPFNPHEAKRLLEEEGWVDLNGDGTRDKIINGKVVPFRFTLTYYVKFLATKVIAEYIATALKEIGVDCRLNGVDVTDLSKIFDDKSFDAIFLGWSLGTPPENPRQLWHSSGAKEKGSSNAIGFANEEIDAIIDRLDYEYDKKKRIELYHRFDHIIHEEAPYTFLYCPKRKLLYRQYVKNVFIPRQRQDLIPGADISSPDLKAIWLEQ